MPNMKKKCCCQPLVLPKLAFGGNFNVAAFITQYFQSACSVSLLAPAVDAFLIGSTYQGNFVSAGDIPIRLTNLLTLKSVIARSDWNIDDPYLHFGANPQECTVNEMSQTNPPTYPTDPCLVNVFNLPLQTTCYPNFLPFPNLPTFYRCLNFRHGALTTVTGIFYPSTYFVEAQIHIFTTINTVNYDYLRHVQNDPLFGNPQGAFCCGQHVSEFDLISDTIFNNPFLWAADPTLPFDPLTLPQTSYRYGTYLGMLTIQFVLDANIPATTPLTFTLFNNTNKRDFVGFTWSPFLTPESNILVDLNGNTFYEPDCSGIESGYYRGHLSYQSEDNFLDARVPGNIGNGWWQADSTVLRTGIINGFRELGCTPTTCQPQEWGCVPPDWFYCPDIVFQGLGIGGGDTINGVYSRTLNACSIQYRYISE